MKHDSPIVIGIAGGTGSGKTTVVRRLIDALGDGQVTVLEHDRYYRDRSDLRLEERALLNYDHPDSLETDLLVDHVRRLKAAQAVDVPAYDFARHNRLAERDRVEPRKAWTPTQTRASFVASSGTSRNGDGPCSR